MDVDFFGVPFFLFQEDRVGVFFSEADDLVFYRRAVAGADAFDLAGIHRGLVEVGAQEVVGFGCGAGLPGGEEFSFGEEAIVKETEGAGVGLGGHDVGFVEVQGAEFEAGGGAGFEAAEVDPGSLEELGEVLDGLVSVAGGDGFVGAFVAESVEEGSGGDDDGLGGEVDDLTVGEFDSGARDLAVFGEGVEDLAFDEGEVGLVGHDLLHEDGVVVLADLGADGLDGRAFSGADFSGVGEGVVGRDGHLSAEGVDFSGDVALCGASDAAVAGEVADTVELEGDAGGRVAHSRGGEGGFDAGMSGSDHDDVKVVQGKLILAGFGWCIRRPGLAVT